MCPTSQQIAARGFAFRNQAVIECVLHSFIHIALQGKAIACAEPAIEAKTAAAETGAVVGLSRCQKAFIPLPAMAEYPQIAVCSQLETVTHAAKRTLLGTAGRRNESTLRILCLFGNNINDAV